MFLAWHAALQPRVRTVRADNVADGTSELRVHDNSKAASVINQSCVFTVNFLGFALPCV